MGLGGDLAADRPAVEGLAAQLRAAWNADTAWIDDWHPRNPARGQCGSTALVIQDLCGGTLLRGLVDEAGSDLTVHYWNALELGQLDVTWAQFPAAARIVLGEQVDREDLLTTPWLMRRYETLLTRVQRAQQHSALTSGQSGLSADLTRAS
jgi:hypothetical protein